MPGQADHDLTLPLIPEAARKNRGPVPAAAYVPITVALIGVMFILVGGIEARSRGDVPAVAAAPAIDPTVTGSISMR